MQGMAGIAAATAIRSQQQSIIPGSSLVPTTVQPTTRSTLVGEHSTSVLQFAQQTLTAAAQPQVLPQQLGSVTQQLSLLQSAIGRHETVASPSLPGSHAYATHMMQQQQQLAASELLLKTNTTRSNIHSTPAAMQVETARIISSSALPNNVLGGGTPSRPLNSWANHPSYAPEPPASSHTWRPPRQAMDQIPYHQSNMNLNNYNPLSRGGALRAPMQPGGSWERNDTADEHDFESWSPENSPIRSHRYNNNNNSHGWNFPQSRLNPGYSYSSSSERPKNHGYPSPSGYRGGNKRWNDRDSR